MINFLTFPSPPPPSSVPSTLPTLRHPASLHLHTIFSGSFDPALAGTQVGLTPSRATVKPFGEYAQTSTQFVTSLIPFCNSVGLKEPENTVCKVEARTRARTRGPIMFRLTWAPLLLKRHETLGLALSAVLVHVKPAVPSGNIY